MSQIEIICGRIGGDDRGDITVVCQQPKGHTGKHGGMGCEWTSDATPGRITGDKGQRFEIRVNPSPWRGDIMGWHDTLDGAIAMAESIVKHPVVLQSWINDRAANQRRIRHFMKSEDGIGIGTKGGER